MSFFMKTKFEELSRNELLESLKEEIKYSDHVESRYFSWKKLAAQRNQEKQEVLSMLEWIADQVNGFVAYEDDMPLNNLQNILNEVESFLEKEKSK